MAAHRDPNSKQRDLLSEILDFGPEMDAEGTPDLTERIRKVKEKIEEINERIARLTTGEG